MESSALVGRPIAFETARLLWEAARPEPDVEAIRALADRGADLDGVAVAAYANFLGPLCHRAFTMAGIEDRLGPVGPAIKQDADVRRVSAQLLLPIAMQRIVDPLAAAGLEPLIFKGPALAARYPDPGLRPMDDVDVILPEHQHARAVAVLLAAGWQTIEQRPGDHYDTFLTHPDVPDLPLELHWDLAVWKDRATSVRAEDLWRRRHPSSLFGTDAYVLPVEEELVALANHAGKPFHHFSRLVWSVDIAVVIQTAPGRLDWDRVRHAARRWDCRTVLAVALHHARRFGAEVPEELLRLPSSRRRLAAIQPVLDEEWPFTIPDERSEYRLRYAFSDSRARQAELLAGEVAVGGTARDVPGRVLGLARRLARLWREDRRARRDDEGSSS